MTSYVNTTAVSIRKGSTDANNGFTGVLGEVTADLGKPDPETGRVNGTDINATLRLHNGITTGGIRMARADTRNLTTEVLAEHRDTFGDKNLAYASLSNLEELDLDTQSGTINNIMNIFMDYGVANKDCRNIDTKDLATSGHGHSGEDLAYKNMSNVNTVNLATHTGHSGDNLAYANMSNVDTVSLATGENSTGKHLGKNLAYADGENINTVNLGDETKHSTPLAYADLTNASVAIENILIDTYNVETQNNKDDVISDDEINYDESYDPAVRYPSTLAVKDYVNSKMSGSNYLYRDLSNASSWDILYTDAENSLYSYEGTILDSDPNIEVPSYFPTPVELSDDSMKLAVVVTSFNIDHPGQIATAEIVQPFGTTDLTGVTHITIKPNEDSPYSARFKFKCTKVTDITTADIYAYEIDEVLDGGDGFSENVNYEVASLEPAGYDKYITPSIYVEGIEVDSNGKLTEIVVKPTSGITSIATGDFIVYNSHNRTLSFSLSSVPQFANGAGLAKINLTNLAGMEPEDIDNERESKWRIRHDINIPSVNQELTSGHLDDEYYRLVTSGLVHDALIDLLDKAHPIGSSYSSIHNICPLQSIIPNSKWELLEEEINLIENESGSSFYLNTWLRVE